MGADITAVTTKDERTPMNTTTKNRQRVKCALDKPTGLWPTDLDDDDIGFQLVGKHTVVYCYC